jgi:hypothetical protein
MNKFKPTTTPALIDKARACTSAKDVIQTLFSTKHVPNSLERKEAKKIFLKEGIPWPSARGRKRKGVVVKKVNAKEARETVAKTQSLPFNPPDIESVHLSDDVPSRMDPVAFCPACGSSIFSVTPTQVCAGCGKNLDVEIKTSRFITVTAE